MIRRRFRLIALDIDGTIRDRERRISERTMRAISRVRDRGALVTLATGRTFRSAIEGCRDLRVSCPVITFQGAHVARPDGDNELLWHAPLTSEMTAAALDALRDRRGFDIMAYLSDDLYVMEMSDWAEDYGRRHALPIEVVAPADLIVRPMTRLVVRGDEDDIADLVVELNAHFGDSLYVTRSLPYFCEILNPDAGKDKAMRWLCRYLGISFSDTLAFGDGYNDVPMLRHAGLGVAVDGAVPEVLEVADFVAPPMEEDGVARVLERLLDEDMIG